VGYDYFDDSLYIYLDREITSLKQLHRIYPLVIDNFHNLAFFKHFFFIKTCFILKLIYMKNKINVILGILLCILSIGITLELVRVPMLTQQYNDALTKVNTTLGF
jgi:hypothetical protein